MRRRQPKAPTCKILTFAFDHLHLGLRVEAVQRVVRLPQIHKTSSAPLGIALVGEAEVLVLDLYHNLFQQDMPSDRHQKRYFITVKHEDTLYGIPTLEMPLLQEIPLTVLKPTPPQYRAHDPLGVASHVFQSGKETYFLLDPHSLWQALVAKQNLRQAMMQMTESSSLPEAIGEFDIPVDTMSDFLDDFSESESPISLSQTQSSEPVETEDLQVSLETEAPIDTMSDFLDDFIEKEYQPLEPVDDLEIILEAGDDVSPIRNFDVIADTDDTVPDLQMPSS